jgi:membrane protease YdiL (CAAX protease family)
MISLPPRFLQCRHRLDVSLPLTLSYCLVLSSIFVCSLYVLVPPPVRRLPRDDARHVKWRAGMVLAVSAAAGVGAYPWLFCAEIGDLPGDDVASLSPPWHAYLGFIWTPMQDVKIAMHVLSLYLGAIACSWLGVYRHGRILRQEEEEQRGGMHRKEGGVGGMPPPPRRRLPISPGPRHLLLSLEATRVRPTRRYLASLLADEGRFWTTVRDLAVAPLAEEVVFRACLLPPLLAARRRADGGGGGGRRGGALSPVSASWIAPLFFGVAHLHHLYERIRRLPPAMRSNRAVLTRILLGVMVQWTYTTLFGAYVSHVFVRTGSFGAVATAHVVCNCMGLPDVGPFADPTSDLRGYRWLVATVYLAGMWLFVSGFNSPAIFPGESVLPSILYPATMDGRSSSPFVVA